MDIQMPVMDGYEATRRIKADPALKGIPVIAVTSYALSGDEAKTRAAGCDGYIAKPYSPRQMLAKVREVLAGHKRLPMREPARILVVDDVADNVEILRMRLSALGYEVVERRPTASRRWPRWPRIRRTWSCSTS